jgi:hypothetical protein
MVVFVGSRVNLGYFTGRGRGLFKGALISWREVKDQKSIDIINTARANKNFCI